MRKHLFLIVVLCVAAASCSGYKNTVPASSAVIATDAGLPSPQDMPCRECAFTGGIQSGTVQADEIAEASGIVASRLYPLLWVHNDSGDTARIFAITPSGRHVCTCNLENVQATDWEDIALGPGPKPGTDYLYIADIGDNRRHRKFVTIYRIQEPDITSSNIIVRRSDITALDCYYPDGPHNAETLLSDPITGDLIIVTKEREGTSELFCYPFSMQGDLPVQVRQIATLHFGGKELPGSTVATGGDISPSGKEIIIKTYDHAFLWKRSPKGLAETFSERPCTLQLMEEPQGEAICFSADGLSCYTLSEGLHQPIWLFKRK